MNYHRPGPCPDQNRTTVEPTPAPGVPLLVFCDRFLSRTTIENIRKGMSRSCNPGAMTFIEPGFEVYQFVAGLWRPVRGSAFPVPQEQLEREGIRADTPIEYIEGKGWSDRPDPTEESLRDRKPLL